MSQDWSNQTTKVKVVETFHVLMKIVKEDHVKHEFIAEDSRGYRFRFIISDNNLRTIEECMDYNIKVKPKKYPVFK